MPTAILRAALLIVLVAMTAAWAHADVSGVESANEKVARLTDEQVREILIEKLEAEAADTARQEASAAGTDSESTISRLFFQTETMLSEMFRGSRQAVQRSLFDGRHWKTALDRILDGKGGGHLAVTFLLLLVCIAIGIAAEMLVRRPARQIRKHLLHATQPAWKLFQGHILSNALLEILYAAAFFVASMLAFAALFKSGEVRFSIASAYMITVYYLRMIILASQVFFSPGRHEARLIPMSDGDVRFIYKWIIGISCVAAVIAGTGLVFTEMDVDASLVQVTQSAAGMAITLLLAVMIWTGRKRATRVLFDEGAQLERPATTLGARFAGIWHIIAIAGVLVAGLVWQADILGGGGGKVVSLIISIFVIPVFIVLDLWIRRLITIALESGSGPEADKSEPSEDLLAEPGSQTLDEPAQERVSGPAMAAYVPVLKFAVRIVLLAFMLVVILHFWNIELPLGRLLTTRVLSILITLLLGLAAWQFIKATIDKNMQSETPEETSEDNEAGGAGGSRRGTLLVLLRKFVFAVLVVVVGLTVLSGMGVNIAPLIAGAGVFGLAIGFGAQTLVKDILSGVFFLIDDAFRVGDYIEVGSTKGMIEHISLRSLRLRHPRGMVHTIPFSDINTVTNFSRDYIITKLDFRVRYDADVEKIRKIIKKKVYKVILKNEELGPKLLAPIKSQGVRELGDSAMVMRVKYKTTPGEQFAIRKEVFRLMQEAFQEEGIEFAHRNVTVYLPQEAEQPNQQLSSEAKEKIAQAGAAAAAAEEAPKA